MIELDVATFLFLEELSLTIKALRLNGWFFILIQNCVKDSCEVSSAEESHCINKVIGAYIS